MKQIQTRLKFVQHDVILYDYRKYVIEISRLKGIRKDMEEQMKQMQKQMRSMEKEILKEISRLTGIRKDMEELMKQMQKQMEKEIATVDDYTSDTDSSEFNPSLITVESAEMLESYKQILHVNRLEVTLNLSVIKSFLYKNISYVFNTYCFNSMQICLQMECYNWH